MRSLLLVACLCLTGVLAANVDKFNHSIALAAAADKTETEAFVNVYVYQDLGYKNVWYGNTNVERLAPRFLTAVKCEEGTTVRQVVDQVKQAFTKTNSEKDQPDLEKDYYWSTRFKELDLSKVETDKTSEYFGGHLGYLYLRPRESFEVYGKALLDADSRMLPMWASVRVAEISKDDKVKPVVVRQVHETTATVLQEDRTKSEVPHDSLRIVEVVRKGTVVNFQKNSVDADGFIWEQGTVGKEGANNELWIHTSQEKTKTAVARTMIRAPLATRLLRHDLDEVKRSKLAISGKEQILALREAQKALPAPVAEKPQESTTAPKYYANEKPLIDNNGVHIHVPEVQWDFSMRTVFMSIIGAGVALLLLIVCCVWCRNEESRERRTEKFERALS